MQILQPANTVIHTPNRSVAEFTSHSGKNRGSGNPAGALKNYNDASHFLQRNPFHESYVDRYSSRNTSERTDEPLSDDVNENRADKKNLAIVPSKNSDLAEDPNTYLPVSIINSYDTAGFDATAKFLQDYQAFAADRRRSESINTYIDNSGDFARIGAKKSVLPIYQLPLQEQQSVRHVGLANEGALKSDPEAGKYSLMETTRAIESYNRLAQEAKDAQNHATYLQNSMMGLSPLNYITA